MNKKVIVLGWLSMIASAIVAFWYSGITMYDLAQTIQLKIGLLGAWGPVGYVIVYSFRSLVFFPASVLTALGGMLFGPWLGIKRRKTSFQLPEANPGVCATQSIV